jgi:uncharacterized protein (TIGR03084 family)
VREILSDLVAEQQQLDQFLQRINVRYWSTKTPAKGWDIRDIVSHLAHMEEYAHNALSEGGSRLGEVNDYATYGQFTDVGVKRGRAMRPQDVIEWWRLGRAKVVDALSRTKIKDRVPWFYGDMSARTFATARLAETWAYGLDIHTTVGDDEHEDTDRLRHIIVLAQKMLPWAFDQAGFEYEAEVRIEGIGQMYAKYASGSEDTDQLIRGPAGEICRVAVRRLDPSDAQGVIIKGETAETALKVLRTY